MKGTLQDRKRTLVRDAIYDAAINLFFKQSFESVTVEEIAEAAGVSRRSFFRYFASKDDLLAQSILDYGKALCASIETCPASASPLEVIEHAIQDGIRYVATQPRIDQTIQIAARSPAARQAYSSRLADVDEMLAQAYAARLAIPNLNDSRTRLLSGLTFSIMNVSILSWFSEGQKDLPKAAKHVFAYALHIFNNGKKLAAPPVPRTATASRESTKTARRNRK